MAEYYISSAGRDDSDGLSPDTPWRTIEKLNQSVCNGDTVRFRCGDIFYGNIRPARGTTLTCYGSGEKPVISQYKFPLAHAWKSIGENLWRIDLADTDNFTGNVCDMDANAGFLLIDGVVHAVKRFAESDLANQWEFYSDDTSVTVFSHEHPADLAEDIRIACNIRCVNFADGLTVENLVFDGTGGHGISGTVQGALIRNCDFINIGGSRLPGYPNPTTRYGNGVECWSDSSDVTVEDCTFTGIYDVAITMQGNEVKSGWKNMTFRRNLIYNCQQAFEIWSSYDSDYPGTGFVNCRFEDNVCLDSGYCWGYDVRPNKGVSCHLLLYHLECPLCDITVTGNIFSGARLAAIWKTGGCTQIPAGYRIAGNTFVLGKDEDLCNHGTESSDEYEDFCGRLRTENRIRRR